MFFCFKLILYLSMFSGEKLFTLTVLCLENCFDVKRLSVIFLYYLVHCCKILYNVFKQDDRGICWE